MPQMRTYEVTTTNAQGVSGSAVVKVHSPADFLQHATMSAGEKAKPGKVYAMPDGATLTYKTITAAQYSERVEAERAAGEADADTDLALSYQDYELGMGLPITPVSLDPEPEQPASDFKDGLTYSCEEMEAEPGEHSEVEVVVARADAASATRRLETERVINLRLSVNDDSHLTGETIFDDDVIQSLGFDWFLDGADYDRFIEVANAAGYAVSTPADSMYRFKMAQPATLENITVTTTADKLIDALTPEPVKAGVVRYCEWNGVLKYEAEDTASDRAFYFETKAEAESHLREVWGIESITYEESDTRPDGCAACAGAKFCGVEGDKCGSHAEPLPEGSRASVTVPATVALYSVPKLSKRQLRRKPGRLFGVTIRR